MANGETLTVQRALKTITDLEGLEPRLYMRTEGLTWMIWGLVGPGIFLTYEAVVGQLGHSSSPLLGFLWLPWVTLGMIATAALWRSVHLDAATNRSAKAGILEGMTYLGIFLGILFVGFTIYALLNDDTELREPGFVTLALGTATIVLSIVPYPRSSRAARRVNLVVGVLLVGVAAILGTLVTYPNADQAYFVQSMVGAATSGLGWFLGGLFLLTKG